MIKRKRDMRSRRKLRNRDIFDPACAANGLTKGYWLTSLRHISNKRRIRRQFGRANSELKIIRKTMTDKEVSDA
jgi:hypothetical protein